MAKAEEIFDQLWTLPVAYYHYTFNACTSAASDPIRGFESIISVYDYLMSLGDPRVAHWPLMKSTCQTEQKLTQDLETSLVRILLLH